MRLLWTLLFCLLCSVAQAQNVIRDAEIEKDLRTIATPIFQTAGLNPDQIRIIVLNDDTINAFVAGGQNLFLYSGVIFEAKSVDELGGIIAHESGHMAGGHLIRMRGDMERASVESIVSTLAGLAVGVGGGDANAGIGIAAGGGELARRRLLSHSRVFESSADQSAISTLGQLGYSAQGMADFLERLSAQEVLPETQRSGYVMTHPLSRERLEAVEASVARNKDKAGPWPAAWQQDFLRLQAKLLAFSQPQRAEVTYRGKTDIVSRYALAIAAYRQGRIAEALTSLTKLQGEEPDNPYFMELRGQILFEQGRIPEAITAYRAAVKRAPDAALIHLSLAQALLQNETGPTDEALAHLIAARDKGEKNTPAIYRWMAIAQGRAGHEGLAKLSLAEEALLKRNLSLSVQQANAALKSIPASDTAARQRAQDILQTAQRLKEKKDKDD